MYRIRELSERSIHNEQDVFTGSFETPADAEAHLTSGQRDGYYGDDNEYVIEEC